MQTVASYAGAMPELGKGNKMVSFSPPADTYMCAYFIEKFFLIQNISIKPMNDSLGANQINTEIEISTMQIEIYKSVFHS